MVRSIGRRGPRAATLALAAAAAVLMGSVATAGPAQEVVYEGQTEQRLPLVFTVADTGSGFAITDMSFNFTLVCEESGDLIGASAGFSGFDIPIVGGQFTFDYNSVFNALHWTGSITQTSARGNVDYLIPGLTPDEQAQLCPSGSLRWGARPTGPSAPDGAGRVDIRIDQVRRASGEVTTTVTRTEG